jgi:tetratricopeptide (TPR) repeat protein
VLKLGKWSIDLGPAFTGKWSVAGGTALAWLVLGLLFLFIPRAPSSEPPQVARAPEPQEPVAPEPEVPAPVAVDPVIKVRPAGSEKPSSTSGDYMRFIQQGRTAMEARRYPIASENYRMALKLDAESLEAKEGLGLSLVLAGIGKEADQEAAKLLREVVKQDSSKARAWFGLGMALQLLRDDDEAAKAYKYYLTLEPSGRFSLDAHRALKQMGED